MRSVLLQAVFSAVVASAQTPLESVLPFGKFLQGVRQVSLRELRALPAAKVKDAASLEEMRQHILTMYSGIEVKHSYVLDRQTFDCIPVEQQPSLRVRGLKIASPPPPTMAPGVIHAPEEAACEKGKIPMRRITLEELCRFPTLHDYFRKSEIFALPPPPNK